MTIDVESLQEFTDAELLKLTRLAIAELLQWGQLRTVRGRTFQSATLDELQDLERQISARITGASSGRIINKARRQRS